MFEILEVSPDASSVMIQEQLSKKFPSPETEYEKQFELLTNKLYRDQYRRHGSIDIELAQSETDMRSLYFVPYYFCFLMISMVFLGDDLPRSKRILFILTILTCIHELTLYSEFGQGDMIYDIITSVIQLFRSFGSSSQSIYLLTFEVISYIHAAYFFIFILTISIDSALTSHRGAFTEVEKVGKLNQIKQNQAQIDTLIKDLDKNKKEGYDMKTQ